MPNFSLKILSKDKSEIISDFAKELHPEISKQVLLTRSKEMFVLSNYLCFGLFDNEKLVGITNGWISVRFYSGKQLELDNLVINPAYQSKGYGDVFMKLLEAWAKKNNYKTIELNAYVGNGRSHKFYFNKGFEVIGFHFLKKL